MGVVLIFIGAVVLGFIRQHKEKKEVYNNCEKTEIFTISHQGFRNSVYDCSNSTVEIK